MTETATHASQFLSWDELACHDKMRSPYPLDWRATRLPALAEAFEAVRTACGNRPIAVLSAYRTAEWNRKVGGVAGSQHVQGRALDLAPPDGMVLREFYDTIRRLALSTMIRGLGFYTKGWVHIDTRPSACLHFWFDNQPAPETREVTT